MGLDAGTERGITASCGLQCCGRCAETSRDESAARGEYQCRSDYKVFDLSLDEDLVRSGVGLEQVDHLGGEPGQVERSGLSVSVSADCR